VAHPPLTGVLLVGGASRRFGTPKALASLAEETLAEHGRRVLADACDEVLIVGKRGELPLDMLDDGVALRVPLAGVVAGLRAAAHDVAVFLPVDCPLVTSELLRALGEACRDAAAPAASPTPCAFRKRALPVLEARLAGDDLSLRGALAALDTAFVDADPAQLVDVDTRADLARLTAAQGL
jgi:molybdenum cofactor guanylyltransferase